MSIKIKVNQIPKDYKPPKQGEFNNLPDGKYNVKGMKWFSLTDSGEPYLISQKNGNVGRLKFILEDDEPGPPMGLSLGDMARFTSAMGGKVENLPPVPSEIDAIAVSEYMKKVESEVNNSDTIVEVEQKGEWVNYVPGMDIPPGHYIFIVQDVLSQKNNEPGWVENVYDGKVVGAYVEYLFKIVANYMGKPTPYEGATFKIRIPYGFLVDEDNVLRWRTTKSGEFPLDVIRANNFYSVTAGEDFISNDFNPPNPHNIIPYWIEKIGGLPLHKPLLSNLDSKVSKNGNVYYVMDAQSIDAVEDFEIPEGNNKLKVQNKAESQNQDEAMLSGDYETHVKAQKTLQEFFNELAGYQVAENNQFTEKGKDWAKENLTPLKESGKIPGKKIDAMVYMDVNQIIEELGKTLEEDKKPIYLKYKEKISLVLIGEEDKLDIPEDNDMPF